jgi:hypothetical protein
MLTEQTKEGVQDSNPEEDSRTDWTFTQIRKALNGLQFGQVCLTIQNGVVVQVERTERFRYQRRP